ncbi:MAG: hypothetical protein Q8P68_02800, partial [Candidatus Peregrinibacteria bacterium]|nr:hypothetical protein [Candidatus Peregrinibacteria bacterium]
NKIVVPTFVQKVVHTVTKPVVSLVQKAYTAYRTEYDTVETEEIVEHVLTDVSYKYKVEQVTVNEIVEERIVTPLKDKIGLALNYVKNLPRIKSSPSNRGFGDILNSFGRGTPFDGLQKPFRNIQMSLQYEMQAVDDPSNANNQNVVVQRYNSFIKAMKLIAYNGVLEG